MKFQRLYKTIIKENVSKVEGLDAESGDLYGQKFYSTGFYDDKAQKIIDKYLSNRFFIIGYWTVSSGYSYDPRMGIWAGPVGHGFENKGDAQKAAARYRRASKNKVQRSKVVLGKDIPKVIKDFKNMIKDSVGYSPSHVNLMYRK
jgi:hypothetical protein